MSGERLELAAPSLRARVRRAVRLGWRRRRDVVGSLYLLPRASWELRRRGYHAALAWSADVGDGASVDVIGSVAQRLTTAGEVGFAVRLVARLIPDATCLRRTLAQRRLLAVRGIASSVCLGVRPGDEQLAFHAWLEVDGTVVSEDPAGVAEFVRLGVPGD